MGKSRWTTFTLSPYRASSSPIVAWTRLQNGQWKSWNSTIVTGAAAPPLNGAPSADTSALKTGGGFRWMTTFACERRIFTNASRWAWSFWFWR